MFFRLTSTPAKLAGCSVFKIHLVCLLNSGSWVRIPPGAPSPFSPLFVSGARRLVFDKTPFRPPCLVIVVWGRHGESIHRNVPRFYFCTMTLTNSPVAAILKPLKSSTDKVHDMARVRRFIVLFISRAAESVPQMGVVTCENFS